MTETSEIFWTSVEEDEAWEDYDDYDDDTLSCGCCSCCGCMCDWDENFPDEDDTPEIP